MASNVFISWSGQESKSVAEVMRKWLPTVLPQAKPWLSSIDINAGCYWPHTVMKKLQECRIGIVCVTRENLRGPWIHYEVGALFKGYRASLVCPYLLDVEPKDLVLPLSMFQACISDKSSTLRLVKSIKRILNSSISNADLKRKFEINWPRLEKVLGNARVNALDARCWPALGAGAWKKLQPLDFTFLWGNLTDSKFDPQQAKLDPIDDKWVPPSAISGLTWKTAYDKAYLADKHGRMLYFRPLNRVRAARIDKDESLVLEVELTTYLQFAATNLSLESHADFRDAVTELSGDSLQARHQYLANPLNVIGCVVSKDGYLFTPQRGPKVAERPDKYQASAGGFVDRNDLSAEEAFMREIEEELGIKRNKLRQVDFIGFGYNEVTGEPDILAVADCALNMKDILDRFNRAKSPRIKAGKDPDELSALISTEKEAKAQGRKWKSVWKLDSRELPELFRFIASYKDWSQPSDRAAVLGTLCRKIGKDQVLQELGRWHP